MPKKNQQEIELPKWRGLYQAPQDGALSRLVNLRVTDSGEYLERVMPNNLISSTTGCVASRGFKNIHELRKASGDRYIFVDVAEDLGLDDVTAPTTKATTAATTGGSMSVASYGSVVFQSEGTDNCTSAIAYGNTYCDQERFVIAGQTHTDWADASVNFVIEIDGINAKKNRAGEWVDTYRYSHDNGSTWEQEDLPIQWSQYEINVNNRTDSAENFCFVAIGNSADWYKYSDVFALFLKATGHNIGDKWSFALNPYSLASVNASSITYADAALNDVTTSGSYSGLTDVNIVVEVDATGTPDTFRWSDDGGETWDATGVSMAATVALGSTGVTIACAATTGHELGSRWSFPCYAGSYYVKYTYATYSGTTCTGETDPVSTASTLLTLTGSNNAINATPTESGDTYDKVNFYRTLANDDSGTYYYCGNAAKSAGTTKLTASDDTIRAYKIMQTSIQDTILLHVASTTNNSTAAGGVSIDTWANVTERLSESVTTVPSWANMNDYAYRVDGSNATKVFVDNSTFYEAGVTAPVAEPVCTSTTGGDLMAGQYYVCYTYVKYDSNSLKYIESNPSPKNVIEITGDAINVPVIASRELGVDYIRIYRTLSGDLTTLYRATQVANTSATIKLVNDDDSISNSLYLLDENNYKPPLAKYIAVAGGRMVYMNITESDVENGGYKLRYSKYDEPEMIPDENENTIDQDSGYPITGGIGWQETMLVFTRKSFYKIDDVFGDDGEWKLIPVSRTVGLIDNRTLKDTGDKGYLIWLSDEGVIAWNGETLNNIGNDTIGKDRVNGIIKEFYKRANVGAGIEFMGEYDGVNKEYHLLCVTRNSAETAIQKHKHLVYNLDSDAWHEIQTKDSSDNREYETSIGVITDDKSRDILVSATIQGTTGTTTYFNENNYDIELASNAEILDSTGDGTTACDAPTSSQVDSDDNVYVCSNEALFKVAVNTDAITEIYKKADVGDDVVNFASMDIDTTNEYLFLKYTSGTVELQTNKITRLTYSGTASSVTTTGYTPAANIFKTTAVDTDGALIYLGTKSGTSRLVRVTDPGGTETSTEIYTAASSDLSIWSIAIDSSDNIYFIENDSSADTTTVKKITDISGTPSTSTLFSQSGGGGKQLVVVSSTEIYFLETGATQDDAGYYIGTLYKATYADSTWTVTACSSAWSDWDIDSGTVADTTVKMTNIELDGNNDLIFTYYDSSVGVTSTRLYRAYLDEEQIRLVATYSGFGSNGIETASGLSTLSNDSIIVCGYGTDNAFRVKEGGYWANQTVTSTSWDSASEIYYQTMYYDLGSLPTKKYLDWVYFDVESENVSCGYLYSQSDRDISRQIHVGGETSEPDGSKTGQSWIHTGEQEWDTSNYFDDDSAVVMPVEHRERVEIRTHCHGNKFRLALKGGTHTNSYDGKLKIGVPTILFRAKHKTNE